MLVNSPERHTSNVSLLLRKPASRKLTPSQIPQRSRYWSVSNGTTETKAIARLPSSLATGYQSPQNIYYNLLKEIETRQKTAYQIL